MKNKAKLIANFRWIKISILLPLIPIFIKLGVIIFSDPLKPPEVHVFDLNDMIYIKLCYSILSISIKANEGNIIKLVVQNLIVVSIFIDFLILIINYLGTVSIVTTMYIIVSFPLAIIMLLFIKFKNW